MTELYINDKLVMLDSSTKIKLTTDNVYLNKSSSYTLDVKIPLSGDNKQVFSHINRLDVSKNMQTMSARLVVNNMILLSGTAACTGVSNEYISVQLLSGNSELNLYANIGELYIDEFSYEEVDAMIKSYYWNGGALVLNERNMNMYGSLENNPTLPFVALPIYNESASEVYNKMESVLNADGTEKLGYTKRISGDRAFKPRICAQPYMVALIEWVFKGAGYTVIQNDIRTGNLKDLIMANATPTATLSAILPHWTMNEFITEVENFYGIVTVVSEGTKEVRLVKRTAFFNGADGFVHLNEIEDEWDADIDDEDSDLSNGNVGFDFEIDSYACIPEDILQYCTVKEFDNWTSLYAFLEPILGTDESKKYLLQANGQQYIDYDGDKKFIQVNQFRNRIAREDTTSTDISLKISPVKMILHTAEAYHIGERQVLKDWDGQVVMMSIAGNTVTEVEDTETVFNIQSTLDGNEIKTIDKPDRIRVAFCNGQTVLMYNGDNTGHRFFPMPWTYIEGNVWLGHVRDKELSLNKIDGVINLYSETVEGTQQINRTKEICIKFISNKMYSPLSVFVIHNKKYICNKIETTVTAKGIDKLKTGYFYELN